MVVIQYIFYFVFILFNVILYCCFFFKKYIGPKWIMSKEWHFIWSFVERSRLKQLEETKSNFVYHELFDKTVSEVALLVLVCKIFT